MKQRNIDTSREARLWIIQIIAPAIAVVALVLGNSDIKSTLIDVKDSIKAKFSKK